MTKELVRTRFAPSPTGYLHIGGVRTALFNWLFARKHGGQFILRIDDTDQQRNVAEAMQPILHGFRWLGLDWDEGAEVGGPHGPYYQSQKLDRYREAVRELVEKGHAYWDYATEEEVKAERAAAEAEKRPFLYGRRWMAETPAERAKYEAEGRKGVVRLKMPREGACRYTDLIRGDMEVKWAGEQDSVVQRADGTVLYNLANVVDDFDMKISHVIRAEEHLSNTPRQIFIAQSLGYPLPQYAHVPFVAEPGSKNKLSKRKIIKYLLNQDFNRVYEHGLKIAMGMGLDKALGPFPADEPLVAPATGKASGILVTPASGGEHGLSANVFNPVVVDFYREVGYLPDAILNYLVLLGWSLDDKTEFFTRQEMIDLFSLERVNKGPASLDVKKLFAFEERYFQLLPLAEKVERALPYLMRAGLVGDPIPADARALATHIITEAGPRLAVAGDILNYAEFFQPDDQIPYDEKAFDKHIRKAPEVLRKARGVVAGTEPFDAATLQRRVEEFAAAEGVKAGPVSQTLRVAVTGKEVGFSAYGALATLGKECCLARIDRALGRLAP